MPYELVVIGGGPAGLAAALEARKEGIKHILILERDKELGGILQQCIHNGFGLHQFKEELTGPEYAGRFIEMVQKEGIEYKLGAMVVSVNDKKEITYVSPSDGLVTLQATAIVLAMGCRERPRGALSIPGTRPSGIFTAGTAQRYVNMEGKMVGKRVVILGSGDIGLIMARRMTLEGAKVEVVAELMPYSGGLTRNIVQCLEDFNIPLKLSHTVTEIHGTDRVTGVTIAKVDANRKPIHGTEITYECDTLLLSVGLVPENEISESLGVEMSRVTSGPVVNESMQTSIEGIFACGNVVHVHDLVDFVTKESQRAGASAARYIQKRLTLSEELIHTEPKSGVRYVIPNTIDLANVGESVELFMRVTDVFRNVKLVAMQDGKVIREVAKKHLAPGEMEKLVIPIKNIAPAGGEITVMVKEA